MQHNIIDNINSYQTDTKKVWFISRHEGAIFWAKKQNLPITNWAMHLDINSISQNDIVIGTLPIHLAAMVCERGAIFYNLEIPIPQALRGKELSYNQMLAIGCQLTEFKIIKGQDYDLSHS